MLEVFGRERRARRRGARAKLLERWWCLGRPSCRFPSELADRASDMPPHSACRRKPWLGPCMTSAKRLSAGAEQVEPRMFKRFRIAAMGLGLVAATAVPAFAQGTLRIGMTAADIPQTTGQPDQGFEGFRFAGYTIYDALVNWDLSKADAIADIKPGLATEVVGGRGRADQVDLQAAPGRRSSVTARTSMPTWWCWNLDKILNDKSPQFDPKQAAQARGARADPGWLEGSRQVHGRAHHARSELAVPLRHVLHLLFQPDQLGEAGQGLGQGGAAAASGTGPFKVDRVVPRERWSCRASTATGTRRALPSSTRCCCSRCRRRRPARAALLAGQVDWIEVPAPDAIPRLEAGRHDHRHQQVPAQLGLPAQHG